MATKRPRPARLTRETAAITRMRRGGGAMRRATIGTTANDAKLAAEIHADCKGRARESWSNVGPKHRGAQPSNACAAMDFSMRRGLPAGPST